MEELKPGDKIELQCFYADIPAGVQGMVTKAWTDPSGTIWLEVSFGKMQDGHKIKRSIPKNMLTPPTR